MPRSKDPSGYPEMFPQTIEAVLEMGQPMGLTMKDEKAAQHLRFRFYSFLKACRNLPDDTKASRYKRIGTMGYRIIFTIRGTRLTIGLRDDTEEARMLEDSLNEYLRQYGDGSEPLPVDIARPTPPPTAPAGEKKITNPFTEETEDGRTKRPTHEEAMAKLLGK